MYCTKHVIDIHTKSLFMLNKLLETKKYKKPLCKYKMKYYSNHLYRKNKFSPVILKTYTCLRKKDSLKINKLTIINASLKNISVIGINIREISNEKF